MRAPPYLEITTAVQCGNACKCCPQDLFVQSYPGPKDDMLTMETFKRCLDHTPPGQRVAFAGFCEPLRNPDATKMATYAHEQGRFVEFHTTMRYATDDDMVCLGSKIVGKLGLHLPDLEGNCTWPTPPEWKTRLATVLNSRMEGCLQTVAAALGTSARTIPMLWDILPDNYASAIVHRAGNVPGANVYPVKNPKCNKTNGQYDRPILLPNGDVVLCCMDYRLEAKCGNLLAQRWDELNLSVRPICGRCEWAIEGT